MPSIARAIWIVLSGFGLAAKPRSAVPKRLFARIFDEPFNTIERVFGWEAFGICSIGRSFH